MGGCNNDNIWPEKIIRRGHVGELSFHHKTKDSTKRKIWEADIGKGKAGFKATNKT